MEKRRKRGLMSEEKRKYTIMSDEIIELVSKGEYAEAADIADQIDWRKVRSYTMLQRISDLYKVNNRLQDALDIMLLAYDRSPNSKSTVFSICELYLETGDQVSAMQYMSVYNRMAPGDVGGDILKYELLEYAEATYEERVAQLEKIASKSLEPEWTYQLAYMYHCMGLATRCVECCDKLISLFGKGPFVIKAMELKMLHAKLSESQQAVYDKRNDVEGELSSFESDSEEMPGATEEDDFHVKTIDMSKFNTINLQKALAESMRELMGDDEISDDTKVTHKIASSMMDDDDDDIKPVEEPGSVTKKFHTNPIENVPEVYDDGGEVYSENGELLFTDDGVNFYTPDGILYEGDLYYPVSDDYVEEQPQQPVSGDTIVMPEKNMAQPAPEKKPEPEAKVEAEADKVIQETFFEDKTADIYGTSSLQRTIAAEEKKNEVVDLEAIAKQNTEKSPIFSNIKKDGEFNDVLSVGNDGQISLVMPGDNKEEKQITGQLNIEDVLAEWEKVKEKKQAQHDEEVKQNILEQTGKIFEDFDEDRKNGVIAQIEEEQRKQKRVLGNEVELKKYEDIVKKDEPSFDATAALNKVYDTPIWDEVDKAVEADKKKSAAPDGVVETLAAGAAVAGAIVAGEKAAETAASAVTTAVIDELADIKPAPEGDTIELPDEVREYSYSLNTTQVIDTDQVSKEVKITLNDDAKEEPEAAETETTESAEEVKEEETPVAEESAKEETVAEEAGTEETVVEEPVAEEPAEEPAQETGVSPETNNITLNTEQISDIGSALEEAADKETEKAVSESNDDYNEDEDRDFSYDEQIIFEDFLYSKKMRAQILEAVDVISLASYVGNVFITGESGMGTLNLAKAIIKEIQLIDSNFIAAKVAKISGNKMNNKDIPGMFMQLSNGALIIEKAGKLTKDTLENITRALENAGDGIIVIMTDTKKEIDRLVNSYSVLTGYFNARVDIVPMSDNALVEYAKKYAYSQEFKIDEERGVLALHARISELQIGEHIVTTGEVEEIVDEAIDHASRFRISNFTKILAGKRYDYEDMIILYEKDFKN